MPCPRLYPDSGAQYRLRVTAGTENDATHHQNVEVNGAINSLIGRSATANLAVKVKNYHGFPLSAPATSNYFDNNLHRDDVFSIAFSIVFDHDVNGNDLVFGNFFDHPIEHKLPAGFCVLTGLEPRWGDKSIVFNVKGKLPSVHAPALTSFSQLRIGIESPTEAQKLGRHSVVIEGSDTESGSKILEQQGVPTTAMGRKQFFQAPEKREAFWFFRRIQYLADFGNHDLNFRDLCLNYPGKEVPYYQLLDDQEHQLRYTLKNVKTGQVYLVVVFSVAMSDGEATTLFNRQKAAADLVAYEKEVTSFRRWNRYRL